MSKRLGDPGYGAGWCIHFRSMGQHQTCEAGVYYDAFTGSAGRYDRRPCFTGPTTHPEGRAACSSFRGPTPAEIAAHEAWLAARQEMTIAALAAVYPYRRTHKGKGPVSIDCPACGGKGTLRFSIAASNGHCHAKCSTPECVSWME